MWKFIEALIDWHQIVSMGSDAVAYAIMAAVGTVLFLIRLALALFAGTDGGDFETGLDSGDAESAFSLFSLLSVLAFFMGTGWMGLACRFDFGLTGLPSAFIAGGFGFSMMLFAATLTWAQRKLNRQIDYDVETAVGRTARVYLTIPEKGQGHGQVEVTMSGRRKIMSAVSTGPRLEAFSDVVVESAMDDETLVVRPFGSD